MDGFCVSYGQPDVAEAEFHVFTERDHCPYVKAVFLDCVDFGFSERFGRDKRLQLEFSDAQFGFQPKSQAKSQVVFR